MPDDWGLGHYGLANDCQRIPTNNQGESVMAEPLLCACIDHCRAALGTIMPGKCRGLKGARNPIVWSCGGGTQSAAIAALICKGELPRPDVAVMADTGREATETWNYFHEILRPKLKEVFVDLVRLNPDEYKTVDLWGGADKDTVLMPMFTNQSGEVGQTRKYCSNEWKSRPIDRYLRRLGLKSGRMWIGFSTDEIHRMRFDKDAPWQHVYPLIDKRMSRADCVTTVLRMGWPAPPRSSCWMCPYRSDQEWRHLKAHMSGDFHTAVRLEKDIRRKDPNLFLHRSCKPLGEVNFNEGQGDLLDQCGSGMCFT